jgi:hypothetical protein
MGAANTPLHVGPEAPNAVCVVNAANILTSGVSDRSMLIATECQTAIVAKFIRADDAAPDDIRHNHLLDFCLSDRGGYRTGPDIAVSLRYTENHGFVSAPARTILLTAYSRLINLDVTPQGVPTNPQKPSASVTRSPSAMRTCRSRRAGAVAPWLKLHYAKQ